ncbi:MAG TPA: hypothetical protein DEW46_16325 [Verrucomicrobia bacterium]|jgi:transglutaminase-like putative cysteine protease|nr:hypothetical protein [Verrucomicrobiota bacterium]
MSANPSTLYHHRGDPWIRLLQAMLILSAGFVYTVAAAAPQTFAAIALLLGLSAVFRTNWPRTTRFVVYSGVTAMLLTTIETQIFPVDTGRFFLLPTGVLGPMLLYTACIVPWFEQRATLQVLLVIATLATLLCSGNVFSLPTNTEPFPFYIPLAQNFTNTYTAGTAIQAIGMVLLLHRTNRASRRDRTSPRWKLAIVLHFLAAGLLTLLFWWTLLHFEPVISRFYAQYLSGLQRGRNRTVLFPKEVNLYRTLPGLKAEDQTVLLRATGDTQPGYLRGRVYDLYNNGRWVSTRTGLNLAPESATGMRAYTIFSRPMPRTENQKADAIDLLPQVRIVSEALFVPGRAFRFELVADGLSDDLAGQITHSEWEQNSGYRVYRDPAPDEAYPLPESGDENLEEWLHIPTDLQPALHAFLQDHAPPLPDQTTWEELPAQTAIRGVEQLLQALCSYSLDAAIASDGPDPVEQFLNSTQAGHCELFAASATMLLRQLGVPARYVTGLVCVEQTPSGYWVARMQDAHAWAEAYDRESGSWHMVEATPPSGLPQARPPLRGFRTWLDLPGFLLAWVMARLKRGEIAEIIIQALVALWGILVWIAIHPIAWPFVVLLIWWIHRRTGFGHKLFHRGPRQDPDLGRLRIGLDKALAKNGMRRAPAETPIELAQRIEQSLPDAAQDWTTALKTYATLRYDPRTRTPHAVTSLLESLSRLQKQRAKPPKPPQPN